MHSLSNIFRAVLIAGSFIYLFIILVLLSRKKLNIAYSIIWIASAVVFCLAAIFPQLVAVLRDILHIETDANFIFVVILAFVILLLLSLSTIVTGFAEKIKRLSQTQALLEKRVRELEQELENKK